MTHTHPLYRFTSLLLSVLLLLQSIAPAVAYLPRAVAQEATLAQQLATLAEPAPLSQPLTIGRVQSTYQAGGTAVITYTIRNNQSAHALPQLQAGLNVTDTVATLASFDPLADPNTLHNLIVRHDFSNATLLDASVWPTSASNVHLFQVGSLAPRAETSFTLTVQLPATAANFTTLGQATVYGTLHGREITATAHPIRLAPSGFAQWLTPTPDVTLQDTAMLMQAAELGDDPLALFDYVQQFGYHAYQGSLRGTRGTLWSEAGNSVDQSSLLIAFLRSAGYPARYRQGTLPTAEARALLASMFPASPTVRGTVPAGTATSDPLNDPDLLALAQEHWWVEAYLPNIGWTTLDPTVGTNGSTPATPSGTATAELPSELRHMLHLSLEVEKYNSFPLGGLNLQTSTVLTASLPSAETTGAPINLGFAVSTDSQGGLTFVNIIHTYTPYLNYGTADATIIGTPVQDLLTNFPLATHFTTGVWLNITTTAPDGRTETHRRMIKDLIGADGRQGGAVQLPPRDESPLLSASDLIQVHAVSNSDYPASEADRIIHRLFQQLPQMVSAFDSYAELTENSDPTAITTFASDQLPVLVEAQFTQLDLLNALFQYGSTSPQRPLSADTLLVTSYPDQPKLLLSSQVSVGDGSLHTSFELLSIAEKAIATPGQNSQAVGTANYLRTTSEKTLEYEILTQFGTAEVRSAVRTLLVAAEQNIPTRFITAANLFELNELDIPSLTKAHITEYAQQGAMIWVPEQMVALPYGEDIGFMAVMPDGNAAYVNAEGHTAASMTYGQILQEIVITALIRGAGLGFVGGFLGYIFTFFAEAFFVLINYPPGGLGDLAGYAAGQASGKSTFIGLVLAAKAAVPLPMAACGASPNAGACQGGVAAGYLFVVTALVAGLAGGGLDPSLPNFWIADLPPTPPAPLYVITRTQTANLPAGTVTLNLPASHHWAKSAAFNTNWVSNGQQIAQFESLEATSAVLSQNGTPLGNGSLTAQHGTAQLTGNGRAWALTGNLSQASYGSASTGLALAPWGDYTATASGTAPLTTQLRTPQATLNNNTVLMGDLTAVFNSPVTLNGTGTAVAPSPHFATTHSYTLSDGQLMLSGLGSGSLTVGGTAVSDVQTVALANYSGAVSLTSAEPRDQISLSGTAKFFTLRLTSEASTLAAHQSTRLLPQIQTNTTDSYRITAYAPAGWEVGLDLTGQLVVTPTAEAAVGPATLFVTAQSTQNPALFASATRQITVLASTGVAVRVALDPVLTVPMGVIQDPTADTPLTLNHIANGRAEIPNAAYNVQIQNEGNAPATFNVSVTGLPAGWAVWSTSAAPQIPLAPGGVQTVGLYVVPPAGALPSAGANFPFTVTAVDTANGANTATANATFTMPGLPFPYLTAAPLLQTVTPGQPVTISLRVQNVGNISAGFPVTVTVRDRHFSTAAVSPTPLTSPPVFNTGTLAPNASFETSLLLDTSTATPGTTYFVQTASVAGEYEPQAVAAVQIASLLTAPLLETAACLIEPMSTATTNLGQTILAIESNCTAGVCPASSRTDLLNAIDSYLATTTGSGYNADTSAVTAARATVSAATTTADLLDALPPLVAAVLPVNSATCTYNQHRVSGRFTPYVQAILLGETADFSLDVTNHGTIATTYAITVAGLPTGDMTFNETIPPGTTASLPVASTPAQLGTFDLLATMTAVVPEAAITVESTAVGRLNVVDKFVQITQVTADPPFVETGTSATNLSVEVANVAGVAIPANAQTKIFAPNGAEMFTADIPLNLLAGTPRIYDLTPVDTSGWAEGVYTVTVNLLNAQGQLIPDGSGYGYFAVGQAVQLSQAVTPELVPPGTFTVTTLITSEIAAVDLGRGTADFPSIYNAAPAGTGLLPAPVVADLVDVGAGLVPALVLGQPQDGQPQGLPLQDTQSAIQNPQSPIPPLPLTPSYTNTVESPDSSITNSQFLITNSPAFTRLEQDDAAISYTGTWVNVNLARASGGSYWRNNVAGSTAEFSFDGTWFNLGFVGDWLSGYAQLHVDGIDYGILDLYRHRETPFSLFYDGLPSGTHTVTLTVLGTGNPLGNNVNIRLDYVDFGDGSPLPAGDFEQDDPRLRLSNGWGTTNYAGASGGSYINGTNVTGWFPFTGESFSLQAIAYSSAIQTQLFVDGVYLDTIDLFHPVFAGSAVTRTFAYTGFTPGPHVVQVMSYQGTTTIDKFTTPAQPPFIDPAPPLTGISRLEADDPAILYNGLPLTQTAQSWNYTANIFSYRASTGEYVFSAVANDTISLAFEGSWIGVGFASDTQGGLADISIDGQFMQTVDLYSRYDDTVSVYFDNLGAGPHTMTVTVQGDSHPNSIGNRVYFDFFDVWDGLPVAEGTFEEDNGRLHYGVNWGRTLQAAASGGAYGVTGINVNSTVWFPFTGDSVTYQAWASDNYDLVEIKLDGVSQGQYNIYSVDATTRTFSFDGLGSGAHVMEVRVYRDNATVDAFITPAIEPATEPPATAVIVRYEEDHPAMRYSGYPFRQMPQNWGIQANWQSSDSYNTTTSLVGNVWNLDFEGEWINLGFHSTASTGAAEIFIDGASQGIFQTADGVNNVISFPFGDLGAGPHTVTAVVISGTVRPDYIDVWDGQPTAEGWHNADLDDVNGLFNYSWKNWWGRNPNIYAHEGDYLSTFVSSHSNIWFSFIGTDLSVLGFNRLNTTLHVLIDGVDYGAVDMAADFSDQPFALHFPDLGEGAHTVQVYVPSNARIDAFHVNPPGFYPYTPVVEWYDYTAQESLPPLPGTGFASSIALGDINGDGVVELIAPSVNGRLYVYRGDGQDAGNGSPIIWSTDVVGPAAEPALADLDNDGLSEIIVSGQNGTFAFHHDGTLLWHNPAVISFYPPESFGWGGPTIGNLDLDPEPEIAIAASEDAVYVLDHEGNILFSDPTGIWPTVPVLADITGDGVLDVIVAQSHTLKTYDFFNGGQLAWSYTLTNTTVRSGAFGAPAVADITADGSPEVIINWGPRVEALTADGTLLWSRYTGSDSHYRPSAITVADATGNGEVNIITASAINAGFLVFDHLLMVMEPDGTLVWEQNVADNSASASGVAAQDLDGDGTWEILWNGATDGFLVIRGSDGRRLFNEPATKSGTVLDYPTLGDVDGDGYAEVVVAGFSGLFVIGQDGVWGDSRPLWNQHNYHITNINDDWSVPISEQNSWELHNTYRTQTPDRSPSPSYQLTFTYTEGTPDVSVLTATATISLTANPPLYTWDYRQEWYAPQITTTFDSLLTNLQPGEVRQVSAGTEVSYRLPSGENLITLPPLYVTVARLGELEPAEQTAAVGGTAVYTLTLTNSGDSAAVYQIGVGGVPADWMQAPASVPLASGETIALPLTVTVPTTAAPDSLPFWVDVDNGQGGSESFAATLIVVDGLALTLTPASQTGPTGQPLSYTLAVANLEPIGREYALTADGLADVTLPPTVVVAAGEVVSVSLTAVPLARGLQPFTLSATSSGGSGFVDGLAIGQGGQDLALAITPASQTTGPGVTSFYSVTLANLGDIPHTAALSVAVPAGWNGTLVQNGQPVGDLTLPPYIFNTAALQLVVAVAENAPQGSYPITVTAVADGQQVVAVATAVVGQRGVSIAFLSGPTTLDPRTSGTWQVRVTNHGALADVYDLELGGLAAVGGTLSANVVSLAPGASQTVQLTLSDLDPLVSQSYLLSVAAVSRANALIADEDTTAVTLLGYEAVQVAWFPASQTVTGTLSAQVLLVITNTANSNAVYDLSAVMAGGSSTVALGQIVLPANGTTQVVVAVAAPQAGVYSVVGTAASPNSPASANASATVTFAEVVEPPPANPVIYLPLIMRQP